MKILAVHNIKGGVGKTTTSVNLSWQMVKSGWNVLLWDLDPQGASSFYFRIRSYIKGGGKALLKQKSPLMDHIKETDFEGLDLLPADFSYRHMDVYLSKNSDHKEHLKKILEPLTSAYDFIVLDCPPSFSRLSESVYAASDAILAPVIPTPLAVRTLNQISDYCEKEDISEEKVLPFFSMVDPNNPNHKLMVENPPRRQKMLETKVPFSYLTERMSLQRRPIGDADPTSKESQAYNRLWKEIYGTLSQRPK